MPCVQTAATTTSPFLSMLLFHYHHHHHHHHHPPSLTHDPAELVCTGNVPLHVRTRPTVPSHAHQGLPLFKTRASPRALRVHRTAIAQTSRHWCICGCARGPRTLCAHDAAARYGCCRASAADSRSLGLCASRPPRKARSGALDTRGRSLGPAPATVQSSSNRPNE